MIVFRASRLNASISQFCHNFFRYAGLKQCESTCLPKLSYSSQNNFLVANRVLFSRAPMIPTHSVGNRIEIALQFKQVPHLQAYIFRRHIQVGSRVLESSNPGDRTALSRNVAGRTNLSPLASRATANAEPSTDSAARRGRGVNERKRNAKQAKEYAEELIDLSPKELRSVAKWVGLSEETVDSIRLAKTLIPSKVKNGWRRQLSYIGGLLRHLDSTLLQAAIKAAKEGTGSDFNPGLYVSDPADIPIPLVEEKDGGDEGNEVDKEEGGVASEVAMLTERWVEGLVGGETSVCEEVYALDDPSFDRQELRRLVRSAQNKIEIEVQQAPAQGVRSEQEQVVEEGGSEEVTVEPLPLVNDVSPKVKEGKGRPELVKFIAALAQRTVIQQQVGVDIY